MTATATRLPTPSATRVGVLTAFLCCAGLPAQQERRQLADPGLMPFRNPQQNVEAPEDLFRDLRLMSNLVEQRSEYEVRYDEEGREYSTHPLWQRTRDAIDGKMFNMAAMFGILLRDSRHGYDRKMAAYGTFYVEKVSDVFELIAFFPGEPVREVREQAFRRSIEFLKVHWPQDKEIEADAPIDPDYPPEALYKLEIGPYLALLDLDDVRDQAQGLWFLKNLCEIRSDCAETILDYARFPLRELLLSEDEVVRREAWAMLRAADPKHREPPQPDAEPSAVQAWLDAVLYDVFPPIRRVNKGRIDLYPSADLKQLLTVGRAALENESIGGAVTGKTKDGKPFRGFQAQRYPEPLDRLGLPNGAILTAIQGMPLSDGQSVIRVLERLLPGHTMLLLEYVHGGTTHAMEYRVQPAR